ncbi:MAG: glycoside hydrolase family 65 protein [Bacteroidota bacterium]
MQDWTVQYDKYEPEKQPLREALLALGNGYFVTRGAAEEKHADQNNYPGTYLAGGYNRLTSRVHDKDIENEDLVNWPNWLPLSFKVDDGDWLDLDKMEVLDFKLELNLREGVLERKFQLRDNNGHESTLLSRRIVSMYDSHVAAIKWQLIPQNWSGNITIRTGIDGSVENNGVARYRDLKSKHLEIIDKNVFSENSLFLVSRTKQSRILMCQGCRTTVFLNEKETSVTREIVKEKEALYQDITFKCEKLQPISVEKLVALFTSKDFAISDPITECQNKLSRLGSFTKIFEKHKLAWDQIWQRSDIEMDSENKDLLILRAHIFHLYQTVSQNSIGLDMGVPSRGWHGEAYRGHIFWDELYIFPFLNVHIPQLARSLLMYRYRRLNEARELAQKSGYCGAMYPWQSGSNGREESQVIHLNPKSGRWVPDNSHLQRHINAAIPYNVWQYYQATNDQDFLTTYGAEIIFNTALFWSSIARMNPKRGRYEIHGVMGPDEYHTKYPDSDAQGLNNNAYTNVMAVWVMEKALELLDMFDKNVNKELAKKVGFGESDIKRWKEITEKMFVPFLDDDIILQFEGFEKLKELDWDKYHEKYGKIMRLDRILEKEGDTPNRYRVSKQADVLMLFYLFSSDNLVELFKKLGYTFKPDYIPKNIDYYQKVTSHGSTLSQVIHSWVYARSDRDHSWKSFETALVSDFKDVQGGTTPEGIHLGAMAGTVDLIQRCYTGLEFRDEMLWLNPRLPENIKCLKFSIIYRSHWIKLFINHKKIDVEFDKGWADPVVINVRGQEKIFDKNDAASFKLDKKRKRNK